jgi:acetyl-CoA carboxylase beta subunit
MEKDLPRIHVGSPIKSYYCPYCREMIMRGNVQKLALICPNCNQFVKANGNDLTEMQRSE